MNKFFKRIVFSAIAVCIAVTSVLLTACNPTDDPPPASTNPEDVGYRITVLYPDGSPVVHSDTGNNRTHVSAILLADNGTELTGYEDGYLNDYGTAVLDNFKTPGEYRVYIQNLPDGYIYDEDIKTSATNCNLTIQLAYKPTVYTVNVNYTDGTPYANQTVSLFNGETQVASLETDANGSVTYPVMDAGRYNVIVNGVPEQYGYKPTQTKMNGDDTDIELFDVHAIRFDDGDLNQDIDDWAEKLNSDVVTRINTSVNNYVYDVDIKGTEEYFFKIYAQWSGRYSITFRGDLDETEGDVPEGQANYRMAFYGDNFGTERTQWAISGTTNSGNNTQYLSLEEGQTYIVSVRSLNGTAYKTKFNISFDREPYTLNTSNVGNFELTFDEIDHAVISFTPTQQGMYRISSSTEAYDPRLECYSIGTGRPISPAAGNDDVSADDKNFSYVEDIGQSYVGNRYLYYVFLNDEEINYPVSISIRIERIGDATPEPEVTTETAQVTETLTKSETPNGTWTWLNPNSAASVPQERDGKWYVTVNGAERQVYVAITKNLNGQVPTTPYSFATIQYFGEGSTTPPGEGADVPTEGGGQQETQQNSYLTVYKDPSNRYELVNYTSFIEAYANASNSDGTYELTGELRTFLQRYMIQHWADVAASNTKPDYEWLLGCGYYL